MKRGVLTAYCCHVVVAPGDCVLHAHIPRPGCVCAYLHGDRRTVSLLTLPAMQLQLVMAMAMEARSTKSFP